MTARRSRQQYQTLKPIRTVEELAALASGLARGGCYAQLAGVYARYMELFRAQVRLRPDAVCVVSAGTSLCYAEFDRQVGGIAGALIAQGIGAGSCVPVLGQRDAAFLAAMLAIFEVGAVYVPLDHHHPAARLRSLLDQLHPTLLLCSATLMSIGEAISADVPGLRSLVFDDTVGQSPPTPSCLQGGEMGDPAYLLFTSGSTGEPKGVVIEHGSMMNHLVSKVCDLRLTAADRIAQTASQCFDISVWQFFVGPILGAQVHIYPQEQLLSMTRFMDRVERNGITVLETVPALLKATLDVCEARPSRRPALESLRWLVVTGKALPPTLCRRWLEYFPSIPIVNAYGPTECSDDVTHQFVTSAPPPDADRVPIGKPILNTYLYVCDDGMSVVPPGAVGELYVGGAGVDRGYLDDAAKTAGSFVPNPFQPSAGLRLYRTGDRARVLSDGSLDCLGRMDLQVKFHGYRIELLEIEAVLRRSDRVTDVAVTVLREDSTDLGIVALVVAGHPAYDPTDLTRHLRDQCQEALPAYMIPAAFCMLASLPRTGTGKLDRVALQAVARAHWNLSA